MTKAGFVIASLPAVGREWNWACPPD